MGYFSRLAYLFLRCKSRDINSTIYRWEGTTAGFVWYQDIPTKGASHWQFFTIGNEAYLSVTYGRGDSGYIQDSKIYRWNGTYFVETQAFPTKGGQGMAFFTIDSQPYLAVANGRSSGSNWSVDSHIYRAALDGTLAFAP